MSFFLPLCYNDRDMKGFFPQPKDFLSSEVKNMKSSNKLLIFILALVFSVAGFFLRRTQLAKELLPGGFLAQGSYLHILLLVLTCLLLTALILLLRPLEQRASWKNIFSPAPLSNILMLLSSLGLLVGNLLLLLTGNESPSHAVNSPKMISILSSLQAPLGLIAAGCVAAFAIVCLFKKKPSALLFMGTSIYLVVRLIMHFQSWNTDPSIHDYCYQLLAAICSMLGVFQLAGFSFDTGKRRMSLFWCLCALFFCGITVADTLHGDNTGQLLVNVSLLLLVLAASVQLLFCKGAAPMPLPEEDISPEVSGERNSDEKS